MTDLSDGIVRGSLSGMTEDAATLGVTLTNLDEQLFDAAGATKRDLVNYLDSVAGRIIPELEDRPLSVIRVHRGQEAFMQKNLPSYTPSWVQRVTMWAESSKRDVSYALCNDRRTLLWFANQRSVEYHPALVRVDNPDHMTHLVLDIDPPHADAFRDAVQAARVVRRVLIDEGLEAVIKTSGAKGLHIFVPIDSSVSIDAAAAATRAIAARAEQLDPDTLTTALVKDDRGGKVFVDSTRVGGATVVAAYSPRVRPGAPVSFPLDWDALDDVSPADFTILTAVGQLGDDDRWAARMPPPQQSAPSCSPRAEPSRGSRPGHARGQARGRSPGGVLLDSVIDEGRKPRGSRRPVSRATRGFRGAAYRAGARTSAHRPRGG